MAAVGHVTEWLGSGLQNRVHRFDSGRGLNNSVFGLTNDGFLVRISSTWLISCKLARLFPGSF